MGKVIRGSNSIVFPKINYYNTITVTQGTNISSLDDAGIYELTTDDVGDPDALPADIYDSVGGPSFFYMYVFVVKDNGNIWQRLVGALNDAWLREQQSDGSWNPWQYIGQLRDEDIRE